MRNCSTSDKIKPKEKQTKTKEDKLTKILPQIDHIISGDSKNIKCDEGCKHDDFKKSLDNYVNAVNHNIMVVCSEIVENKSY